MGSLKVMVLIGAAVVTMSAAQAADLAPLAPQPLPVAEEFASGWYLRGDMGVGAQSFRSFDHTQTNPAFVWPGSWAIESKGMGDAVFFGAGIGYKYSSWLRFDFTGEWRASARFKAVGSYSGLVDFCAGGGKCFDVYDGHHSAAVFLANAYFDLGHWWRITPFVGFGVGAVRHAITDFWDLGLNSDGTTGRGFASNYAYWNFAWAAHAGLAFDVSRNLKIELAYRYLNMGDVKTGTVACNGCGGAGPLAYYSLRGFDSHDFKLGLRWQLDTPVYAPPSYAPLVRKG